MIDAAISALASLGLPRAQLNERSALCLLAVLDLPPGRPWSAARAPLVGITPIMAWIRANYGKAYAPNTRETFRRQTMHQFVAAGIVLYNPDDPKRAVNSPRAVYQVSVEALELLQSFGTDAWPAKLAHFQRSHVALAEKYAAARSMHQVPVNFAREGLRLSLTPGAHSDLIRAILEEFAPRFAPGGKVLYAGDTGQKFAHFDEAAFAELGVQLDTHGKMPDVVIHDSGRNWLVLVEAVTSHGPVDAKRQRELQDLFGAATAPIVYVTAFPSRSLMGRFLPEIAWETEVWVADAPDHLIHFNGDRYLGPHRL